MKSAAILSIKIRNKVYIHCKRNGDPILYNSVMLCSEAVLYLFASSLTDRAAAIAMAMLDFRIHRVEIPCSITNDRPAERLIGSMYGILVGDPKASNWHARGLKPG